MNGNDVLCGMSLRHMLMNEVRFGRIANKDCAHSIPRADGKNMVCNVFNEEIDGKHDLTVTLMRRRIG